MDAGRLLFGLFVVFLPVLFYELLSLKRELSNLNSKLDDTNRQLRSANSELEEIKRRQIRGA